MEKKTIDKFKALLKVICLENTYIDLLLGILTWLHHHLSLSIDELLLPILHHLLLHLTVHVNHIWVSHHLLLLHLSGLLSSHLLLIRLDAAHIDLIGRLSSINLLSTIFLWRHLLLLSGGLRLSLSWCSFLCCCLWLLFSGRLLLLFGLLLGRWLFYVLAHI